MSWLALWFLALACQDLTRAAACRYTTEVTGSAVLVGAWLLAGLTRWPDLLALGVGIAALIAWQRTSTAALTATRDEPARSRGAITALLAPAVAAVLCAGWAHSLAGPFVGWLDWARPPLVTLMTPERAVAAVAAVLAQWGTGNVVVRLTLAGTGVPRSTDGAEFAAEQRLKGGRLLGPMERTFLLGLGLVGQLPAATAIAAAKGLLRFPELQAVHRESLLRPSGAAVRAPPGPQRIDVATEYFLVGTFTSWLFAVVCLLCVR